MGRRRRATIRSLSRPWPRAALGSPLRRARRHGALADLDLDVLAAVRGTARSPHAIASVRGFSLLGEHAGVWLALGATGAGADRARRTGWMRATATVALAQLGAVAVKRLVRRRRPALQGLPPLAGTLSGLSFPSSHACSSFAAARAFSEYLPAPALYGAASAMSLSRVWLGVHYPSDVLAGAVLGTAIAELGRRRPVVSPVPHGRELGDASGNGAGPVRAVAGRRSAR